MSSSVYGLYYRFFEDPSVADKYSQSWPLMGGFPGKLLMLIAIYLMVIKKILPSYMDGRKPYGLKNVLVVYNGLQIIANLAISIGIVKSGWITLGCERVYDVNPELEATLSSLMWWSFVTKITDLVETVFFLLRKKDNQVSFLHVYHHISTLLIIWIGTKLRNGGVIVLVVFVNHVVHVIMYSYYLASVMAGPKLRDFLNKWKKYLTIIQMIQFTIFLIHAAQALGPTCKVNNIILWFHIPNVFMNFALFLNFYFNSYAKKNKMKMENKNV